MLDFLIFLDHYERDDNDKLNDQQKIGLKLRHNKTRDSKEADRIKSVLLRDEGWSVEMTAQALRKNETTIRRHLDDYEQKNKLIDKKLPNIANTLNDRINDHFQIFNPAFSS